MGLKFRRGTTAQKSGSLAFGEPYVNTDLNTLQIGGESGDIILSAAGTSSVFIGQSVSASSWVSASSLRVTGNAQVDGNLTIGGQITIGDNTADTVNVVASLSSSLIPSLDNTFDLGSLDKYWRDIYVSTGSIKMVSNGVVVSTLSNTANGMTLDQGLVASGSIKTYANIIVIGTGSISASNYDGIGNLTTYSASVDSRISSSIANQSGLSQSVYDTLFNPTGLSASAATALSASIDIFSGSVYNAVQWGPNSLSASVATALSASVAELSASVSNSLFYPVTGLSASLSSSIHNTIYGNGPFDSGFSGSVSSSISQLSASVSQSIYENIWGPISISSSVAAATANSISTLSGSIASEGYAKLNASNIFTGTQVVTGSMYVSGDFVVQGSSSLQNITASAVSIGTNTVILNTDSPSVRFGGISVIDQGSSSTTGSLLWDSTNNVWIYQNPEGEGYASAKLISGPKNSGSLGSEVGLTVGQVPVAVGDDHIGNSIISASATQVYVSGSLKIVDVTSELQIVGNLFGQASIVSPNGALVLTPGLYGVQINGDNPDLTVNGTISGSITGIGNVTLYSASVDSRIIINSASAAGAFESASAYSASVKLVTDTLAVSASVAASISGSIQTSMTGVWSASAQIPNLSIQTNQLSSSTISGVTLGLNLNALTIGTGLNGTSYNGTTAVTINNTGVLGFNTRSGSVSLLASDIIGLNANIYSSSAQVNITAATGYTSFSGSQFTRDANQDSILTSVSSSLNVVSQSVYSANITYSVGWSNMTTVSASAWGAFQSASAYSASAATTYAKLGVANTFTANQIVSGSITATGDVVAYSTSDKRHKNNIVNITDALAKVTKLNGVTWEWNDDVDSVTKETPKTGLIAQEVQEVLPEVVKERQDGFLALDYSKMMGLMVEAIKEQQTQIAELKAEIEALKK